MCFGGRREKARGGGDRWLMGDSRIKESVGREAGIVGSDKMKCERLAQFSERVEATGKNTRGSDDALDPKSDGREQHLPLTSCMAECFTSRVLLTVAESMDPAVTALENYSQKRACTCI